MSIKKIYVGAIVNRDLEVFREIKRFAKVQFNIEIKNLIPKKKGKHGKLGKFNCKYFKKKIKKYPFAFFIVKLFSEESNQEIYDALKMYAPNIPHLNSINSVSTCESRKATFKLIEEKYKKVHKLHSPKSYYSLEEARQACLKGKRIIIKLDDHNSPYILKEKRILGVSKFIGDFEELIKPYKDRMEELFFQEYIGKFDIVYKVYVVHKYVASITAQNRLRHHKLSPIDLIHIRVPIDTEFRRRILKLGRKLGMSVFGVDYVLTEKGKRYIVDINDFPSFRRIPEAVSLISEYIYKFITVRQTTSKIPMSLKVKTYTI
jgi:glutathione synthase/RimK-type ligase-like ATP-grasp enzyme